MGELCRVLIVDDELLIRQGIKHYINWEQEGFAVVGEASNGQEALALIEQTNPHIVLTDMVMPIMDGEELTKTIKSRYPHIEIIILSSFGDFDYVRSTFQSGVVDYILKPKLDAKGLLSALQKAMMRIPGFQLMQEKEQSLSQIIGKLLSGYEVELEQAQRHLLPHSRLRVLGVDVKLHSEKGSADFLQRLKKKWEARLQGGEFVFSAHPVSYDQNTAIILLNYEHENDANLLSFIERMTAESTELCYALSEPFVDFLEVGKVVKEELLKLLQYRFYFPEKALLMKQTLPPASQADDFQMERFTEDFKRRDFDVAFDYLDKEMSNLSGCYTKDVFEFKSLLGNIIFHTTVLLSQMNYDVKELEKARYSYFQAIDKASSAQETLQLLQQFIEEVRACIEAVPAYQEDLNLKEIMQYIREHYAEPLTLKEVAKHFHFNPSYLSNYFSSHNDEGFIEYVNRVRIEEATKLLLANTAPISEISSMVGYSDHSYFCKVFKKIQGSSPSQFRRQQIFK
ncbi:response regulator transcription factor [Ectobacillus antri]|jgi:two-component system response regulator YesN|uniref:Response regulator transcription factor n=1 Tax=Ectobacillus antri TaxID=2486280 RepID=A0ABT6H4S5_9BACI|nr:response regulator transcription factor [Ectobacillus antri]MDG4657284.1 response regulator transcription factor [Ectobacillus antri]MDG5754364.1 response regulator transcription factor [Ectobacillus antri]